MQKSSVNRGDLAVFVSHLFCKADGCVRDKHSVISPKGRYFRVNLVIDFPRPYVDFRLVICKECSYHEMYLEASELHVVHKWMRTRLTTFELQPQRRNRIVREMTKRFIKRVCRLSVLGTKRIKVYTMTAREYIRAKGISPEEEPKVIGKLVLELICRDRQLAVQVHTPRWHIDGQCEVIIPPSVVLPSSLEDVMQM